MLPEEENKSDASKVSSPKVRRNGLRLKERFQVREFCHCEPGKIQKECVQN